MQQGKSCINRRHNNDVEWAGQRSILHFNTSKKRNTASFKVFFRIVYFNQITNFIIRKVVVIDVVHVHLISPTVVGFMGHIKYCGHRRQRSTCCKRALALVQHIAGVIIFVRVSLVQRAVVLADELTEIIVIIVFYSPPRHRKSTFGALVTFMQRVSNLIS